MAEIMLGQIDAGLMPQIGRVIITQVLDLATTLDIADFELAFNVSTTELYRNEFADWIIDQTAQRNLSPHHFWIEVSESVALSSNRAIEVLRRLHDVGFRIALDDFGAGQSSLSHLRSLPIDAIKIDRAFVGDLLTDPTAQAISRCLIELGATMGLRVVPEGVETESQASTLATYGATLGQGWLFHPALAPEDLAEARRAHDTDRLLADL